MLYKYIFWKKIYFYEIQDKNFKLKSYSSGKLPYFMEDFMILSFFLFWWKSIIKKYLPWRLLYLFILLILVYFIFLYYFGAIIIVFA